RLVRAVVAIIVVVYREAALKGCVGVFVREADADEMAVDSRIDRPVDEAAVDRIVADMCKRRVRIFWRIAACRQTIDHAFAPWVASEEPVEAGLFQLQISIIARHLSIPVALDREAGGEVVAAPDERDAAKECIAPGLAPNAFDAGAVIVDDDGATCAVQLFGQLVVPEVNERIPLIVIC